MNRSPDLPVRLGMRKRNLIFAVLLVAFAIGVYGYVMLRVGGGL